MQEGATRAEKIEVALCFWAATDGVRQEGAGGGVAARAALQRRRAVVEWPVQAEHEKVTGKVREGVAWSGTSRGCQSRGGRAAISKDEEGGATRCMRRPREAAKRGGAAGRNRQGLTLEVAGEEGGLHGRLIIISPFLKCFLPDFDVFYPCTFQFFSLIVSSNMLLYMYISKGDGCIN
ncbi:hypothetical protein GOP47_0012076, partial [Adiantum capillus-veneris]